MRARRSSRADQKVADRLVEAYRSNQDLVSQFLRQLLDALTGSPRLNQYVHSVRSRLKDPGHLREKLLRKMAKCRGAGERFDIDPTNLLRRITDLAGVRIIHLHTRQIRNIDRELRGILDEQRYALLEGPSARTWDDESEAFFKGCGIETQSSPSLYTSVHYVIGSASRTTITCEIQVRTLMEEVWGEVEHRVNYPVETRSLSCREQLKVLARVTSSATRLVDSIFLTLEEHEAAASAPRSSIGRPSRRR